MELSIEQVLLLFVGYFYDRRKAIFQLAGGENAYVICLPSKTTLISSCRLLWNTLLQDKNSCLKKKKSTLGLSESYFMFISSNVSHMPPVDYIPYLQNID